MQRSSTISILVILFMIMTACGGGSEEAGTGDGVTNTTASDAGGSDDLMTEEEAEDMADDLADSAAESLESQQEARGGGSATLVVGDTTWTFDSVLCAFGEEEIGQEGAEFVLSSLQEGLQLYVSIDSFGHSVSLNDIDDFENPSVALTADGFTASLTGGPEEFVEVDGTTVTASASFVDETSESLDGVEGTLEATCP